ncbi:growth hormone-inducible transmembrane protein-like protein [Leptotrombidium deliense]|uniref:Growth hormone-inducible transmembrane protein-like protein n=1 Tax=Leptotrombidium deliense TaxID=299467 RepID=A0A443SN08_9ACAR|nr:growth hormone-inducible transmembrane protein-like protein [Leptotrombidium deliense]
MNCLRILVLHTSKPLVTRQLLVERTVVKNVSRGFRRETRTHTLGETVGKQKSFRESIMQPTSGKPFAIGQAAVAGASVVGLGALCFYGAGFSRQEGAIDRAAAWPQYVRDRIHATYMYFGGSLIFTAATAATVLRSPVLMQFVTRSSFTSFIVGIGAMMASGYLVQSIPYKQGFGAKQLAWMFHSGVVGTVIAPLALLGGPLIIRAAVYTAGVVGGLSAVAMCAPSEKFLTMGGPLAIGFGAVFAASIGSFFLPPTTALGAGLYSISVYGGLILFSGLLLYDTQKIIKRAETHPLYAAVPYDPINESISIYMDTINIFIRIAMILSGQGGNRRK